MLIDNNEKLLYFLRYSLMVLVMQLNVMKIHGDDAVVATDNGKYPI